MNLKTKLIMFVSACVIVILALNAIFAFSHYKHSIKETIAQQQFRMVSILADEIDNKLLDTQQQIVALSKIAPADIMHNPAKAQAFLDGKPGIHTILDNHLFLFTLSGKIFVESPYAPGRRGLDFSFLQYLINTIKSKTPYISDPFIGYQSHDPVLMFTAPVLDSRGKIKGILAGSVDLMRDNFLGRIGTVKLGETGNLYLIDANGTMVMHQDKKRILVTQPRGLNRLSDAARDGFEGTGETITSYGMKSVSSYKRLKTKNWILAANSPLSEAYRPVRQAERYFLIAMIVGVIVVFFVISSVVNYLITPLESFTNHIKHLPQKTGDNRFLDIKTKDEIGTLSLAFNTMLTEIDNEKTALKQANSSLLMSNEQLRNLAAHLHTVREEERTRIAREIHDELGQALAAQKMELSWFRGKCGDHKPILDKSEAMMEALNETIRSVRRICTELRPPILDDFGLVDALHWQAYEFKNRTRIQCTVESMPEDIELDKERSTVFFRIFQETLTNVLKHANATKVTARLTKDNGNIVLEVKDNGKGITEEELSKHQSYGLIGMRERVHPWGG